MPAMQNRSSSPTPAERASVARVVGSWRLVRWDCCVGDERRDSPLGPDVDGCLTYTPDGWMSAILMRRDRPMFGVPSLIRGPDAAKLAAVQGYVSYAGPYRFEEDKLVHRVELSLLPDWIGTDQVRHVAWRGEDLELSTPPEPARDGRPIVYRLLWRRNGAATRP
jgi:hypothetical protein